MTKPKKMKNSNMVIKFRAWDKNNNEMIYSKDFNPRYNVLEGYFHETGYIDDEFQMQYTGLKDKNGVEIYGEDILKSSIGIHLVKWNEKRACWIATIKEPYNDGLGFVLENECEIIGNLHENPELLK
jgi:hypothetical protein